MPSCLRAVAKLLGGEAVDLVTAVGDEVEDEAQLAEFLGEASHFLVGHAGGVPTERRREVVGEHLVGELGVDRLGELARVIEVGGLGLHPEQVGEGRRRKRLGDGVRNAAAHLVVPLGRLGRLAVPVHVDAEFARLLAGGVERGARGEAPPVVDAYLDRFTFAGPEFDHFGNRLAEGFQSGLVLPRVEETSGDRVEHRVERFLALQVNCRGFGGLRQNAPALQPAPGRRRALRPGWRTGDGR